MILTLEQVTTVTAKCANYVNIIGLAFVMWGHAVVQLVEVAGSIPDGFIAIFY